LSTESRRGIVEEIGLNQLPVDNWDGSVINGQFIPDTWRDGLDHLPYPQNVRDSFKKFRDSLLKIDLEKRENELYNVPFSKFTAGYAPEIKLWWDTYGPVELGCAG